MTADISITMGLQGAQAIQAGFSQITQHTARMEQQMAALSSRFATFGNVVKGALAAIGAANLAREITNTALAFERAARAMTIASGSAKEASRDMEFVRQTSDKLGLNLLNAAQGFAKFSVAARAAGISSDDTKKVFTAVSEASAALGLSTEETNGTLLALSQVASKGVVAAEELRGQIGERVVGAFSLAAKAVGVTEQKLGEMLQSGQLLARDFLPKFGAAMHAQFGQAAVDAAGSAQAAIGRFSSAWQTALNEFAKSGFLQAVTDGLTQLVAKMKSPEFLDAVRSVGKTTGDLISKISDMVVVVGRSIEGLKMMLEDFDNMLRSSTFFARLNQITGRQWADVGSRGPTLPADVSAMLANRGEPGPLGYGSATGLLPPPAAPTTGGGSGVADLTKAFEKLHDVSRQLSHGIQADFGKAADYTVDLTKKFKELQQEIADSNRFARTFGDSFERAFDAMVDGCERFSDVLKDIGRDMLKAFAHEALFKDLGNSATRAASGLFDTAKGFLTGDSSQQSDGITRLQDVFNGFAKTLTSIFSSAWDALAGIFGWLISEQGALAAFEVAERWAVAIWETAERWAIAIFESVAGLFGLDRGGDLTVSRPTLLLVGEHRSERVRVSPISGPGARPSGGGAGPGGGGEATVQVFIPQTSIVNNITGGTYARQIARAVNREAGRRV